MMKRVFRLALTALNTTLRKAALNMRRTALIFLVLISVTTSSHAGLFSRSRTEAKRIDVPTGAVARPLLIDGLLVYSFLQDGAGADKRLRKDIERFRQALNDVLKARGTRASSVDVLAGDAMPLPASEVNRRTAGPIEISSVRNLSEAAKSNALDRARSHHSEENALPASHRLILLPEQVAHATGNSWVWGPGATPGVSSYSFKVYWLLEDVTNQSIVAGTTTGTLDVRGFPAKVMAEQMAEELERLGVHLSAK